MTFLLAPLSIPNGFDWLGVALRYSHILFGITWIGMLYFFNLVNVNFQKEMTASLDPKGNHTQFTKLMPSAMWFFRWGAMWTVITGFIYYALFIHTPGAVREGAVGKVWGVWIVGFIVAFMINRRVIDALADKKSNPEAKAPDQGMIVGIIETVVLAAMCAAFYFVFGNDVDGHVFFIALGGGFGMIMFMNVWMVIWPNTRKLLAFREAFLKDGTAIPPEAGKLARRGFLASRTNAFLSIFLLLLMVLAGHGASLWSWN